MVSQASTQANSSSLGLLDILAAKNGCMYLSDLAGAGRSAILPHHLWELRPEEFSLREWEDAVQYLTGEKLTFSSQEQAREYLAGPIPVEEEG